MKQYYCYQGNDKDCGFACLKMLLATYSQNKHYLNLRKPLGKVDGFSLFDLIKIGEEHGLKLKGVEIKDKMIKYDEKMPMIVFLNDDKYYFHHAVILIKIRGLTYYLFDPKKGSVKMESEQFCDLFDGKALMLESYNQVESYEQKEFEPLKKSRLILASIFPSLAMITLFIGSFFIKKDEYIFLPIIFLVLYALLTFLENWYLLHIMREFDEAHLARFVTAKEGKEEENYHTYLDFKSSYFKHIRKAVSSSLIIGAIMVILVINDRFNAFSIGVLLILAIFDKIFSKDNKRIEELSEIEYSAFHVDHSDEISWHLEEHLFDLNIKTNQYAFDISFRKCVYNFILIALALVIMIFNKMTSTNFIIFHFFMYQTFFTHLRSLLSFDNEHEIYLKKKAQFEDTLFSNVVYKDML